MPKLLNGIKGDSNPGSLDCESVILPLSYRAPHVRATKGLYQPSINILKFYLILSNVINISVRGKCEPTLFHNIPKSDGFVEIREMCVSEEVDLIKMRNTPANPGKLSLRSHAL